MFRPFPVLLAVLTLALLGACTSSTPQDVLEPSALTAGETGQQPASGETAGGEEAGETQQTAAVPQSVRLHFSPVIGATSDASTALFARITSRAGERGVALTGSDQNATHVMRGYFSTISEEGRTTIIYVWDVVDPSGQRVHRIQGQQISGAPGEGWSSVDAAAMEAIADSTIDSFAGWAASAAG